MSNYRKKTTLSDLSKSGARKKRSLQATKKAKKKNVTDKIKKDREKRLKEFREWWA